MGCASLLVPGRGGWGFCSGGGGGGAGAPAVTRADAASRPGAAGTVSCFCAAGTKTKQINRREGARPWKPRSIGSDCRGRATTRRGLPTHVMSLNLDDLPPPVVSNVPGTWAYDTMSRRIREEILLNQVLKDNLESLSEEAKANLLQLSSELEKAGDTKMPKIAEDGGPDLDVWNQQILQDETWLEAPWVVTEYYFYRRVLGAIGYFSGSFGDPFAFQKEKGLRSSYPALGSLGRLMERALGERGNVEYFFRALLLTSLWGNRMDLSIWPADAVSDEESTERAKDAFGEVLKSSSEMLLTDDSLSVWKAVSDKGAVTGSAPKRMDIIADNAGFELICDLCLADFLISSGLADKVVIHLKSYPVFVSDAMEKDVLSHISSLRSQNEHGNMREIASRWQGMVDKGQWELSEHDFWVLPLPFWQIPSDLHNHFKESAMVFVKGDANYRRNVGERQWPFSAPFQTISSYWPAPICCLRTMKSEVLCGVSEEKQAAAKAEDPNWLVSGRYGLVQTNVDA